MKKILLILFVTSYTFTGRAQFWSHSFSQFTDSAASLTAVTANDGGTPLVIYQDNADGNRAKVKGIDGVPMGWQLCDTAVSIAGAADLCIKFQRAGSIGYLYAAFQDSANANRACVLMYGDPDWYPVGPTALVSPAAASNLSLAVDKYGTPYIAYTDLANDSVAVVKKYDGATWITMGAAAASPGPQTNTQLAVDTAGHVYIAYSDIVNGSAITVRKLSDTGWANVGPAGFSADTAEYISLAISRSGTPFVAYSDVSAGRKAMVVSFDGSTWTLVGGMSASEGPATEITMVVDSNETPYIAYRDESGPISPSGCSVRKYTGTTWTYVGSRTFTGNPVNHPHITANDHGVLFVTYSLNTMSTPGKAFVDQLSFAISPGFKNIETTASLNLWPNPASGLLQLRLESPISEPITIDVIDATGRTVLRSSSFSNKVVQLTLTEPPGVYNVRVTSSGSTYASALTIE